MIRIRPILKMRRRRHRRRRFHFMRRLLRFSSVLLALVAVAGTARPAAAQGGDLWIWWSSVQDCDVQAGIGAVCSGNELFTFTGTTPDGLPGQWTWGLVDVRMKNGPPQTPEFAGARFRLGSVSGTVNDNIRIRDPNDDLYKPTFISHAADWWFTDVTADSWICLGAPGYTLADFTDGGIECDEFRQMATNTVSDYQQWFELGIGYTNDTGFSMTFDSFGWVATTGPPPGYDGGDGGLGIIGDDGGGWGGVPTGGTGGGLCYQCLLPTGISPAAWLGWLGCLLVNLFSCHLWSWLLMIVNAVLGVYGWLLAFLAWLPLTVQAILDWTAATAGAVLLWWWTLIGGIVGGLAELGRQLVIRLLESDLVQLVAGSVTWLSVIWELLQTLVAVIVGYIGDLAAAVADWLGMIWELIIAVRDAFAADAYVFDDVLPGGSGLYDSGITPAKITAVVLAGFVVGDELFAEPIFAALMYLMIGIVAFRVVMWTVRFWGQQITA